jgi:nucleoside-diphosphate-sugar epimerase
LTIVKSLIIGCGYLGMRVSRLWRAEDRPVWATTRSPERAEELRRHGLEPFVCDVLKPQTLTALPHADTVLYCVGHDRAGGASMRDVYVTGLANVLDHLPTPRRLLHVSSTSVYGQIAGEWVDEDAATEPREESGRIVLEAEQLLRRRVPEAIILRFAGIYGPGRLRRQALLAGEPIICDGARWLNLIHVDDGAATVLAAEERGRTGAVYNVCDDLPVARREFYEALARHLDAPPPRFVPPPPGTPAPVHESANRRVANARSRRELGVKLQFPSYKEGLPASLP